MKKTKRLSINSRDYLTKGETSVQYSIPGCPNLGLYLSMKVMDQGVKAFPGG